MAGTGEPIAGRVAAAGARTVAAGTARLSGAWSEGSPVPEAADQRCEGIADFAARRARVAQAVMGTAGFTAEFIAEHQDDDLHELAEPVEAIYDGANTYLHVGENWTGFFLGDPGRSRGVNDPLWPLDAPYRGLSQITAEVWLDADGLARRIAVMTDPAAGDGGTPMWSIVELWDFGVMADITPPAPGEVVSPGEAYSQAGE